MMKKMLATALGAGCAVTMILTPTVVQAAADGPVQTNVKFDQGFTYDNSTDTVTMTGTVSSKAGKCEKDRKVVVTGTDTDTRAGADRTNRNEKWKVTFTGADVPPVTAISRPWRLGSRSAGSSARAVATPRTSLRAHGPPTDGAFGGQERRRLGE